jgi:hypothetical protein
MNIRVGWADYALPNNNGFARAVCELIETEQDRVLALRECGLTADEDILIHQVRMYIVRWAIPAVEIEQFGHLDSTLVEAVQKRLWLCMFGRAVDDLHDQDSHFFSLSDSLLMVAAYAALLKIAPGNAFGARILQRTAESLEIPSSKISSSTLSMPAICDDVCRRVSYFLSLETVDPHAAELLRRYVGVMLGRCDLDDCLVDGASGSASTAISRALHQGAADPEGKIHLDTELLAWYAQIHETLCTEAKSLITDLSDLGVNYTASIVQKAVHQWDSK